VLAQLFVRALDPWPGWDGMTAHLTLPRLYLEAGGFRRLPFSVYSHWPSNVQLIYGLGLGVARYRWRSGSFGCRSSSSAVVSGVMLHR
jgi:hypothetical protein